MNDTSSVVTVAATLDERELAILLALAEHKALATDQLGILFFDSDRSTQRVVQNLRASGLIDSFDWRSSGRTRHTKRHHLTLHGARVLASARGCRVADLGPLVDPRQAPRFMPHRSGVNRFFCDLVRLTLLTQDQGLETWRDEHKVSTPFDEVQPDSFGRLLLPGAVEFCFEYDHGTEHRRYVTAKFASYLRIASRWRSLDEKPFPSILFVTTTDDRELGLLRALLAATKEWDPSHASLFPAHVYCTTVARLAKRGQLGPVWRDMFVRNTSRLRLDALPAVDAEPYRLEDCLGRRSSRS